MNPLVLAEGVSMRFRTGLALDRVDLALQAGEFVSLLGPSGCGKSTLLKIVAGLRRPTSGSVRLSGAPAGPGSVGFVFQEPTLLPWADVARNVDLPLRLLGVARREREARTAEALELVGLGDFARAHPRELSGGMQMRVSLARALAQKPRLLLLDEPFAALDEITRFRLNDDLLRLWRHEGWTVLFVTHSVFESAYLSQRVLVMTPRPGRLVADVPIDLPQPRPDELRTSAAYAECCRHLSARLSAALAT
jgi:NitT/TauT family transport system ATP-binding protein